LTDQGSNLTDQGRSLSEPHRSLKRVEEHSLPYECGDFIVGENWRPRPMNIFKPQGELRMRKWLLLVVAGLAWLIAPGRSEAGRVTAGSGGVEPAAPNEKAAVPGASETKSVGPFDAALAASPLLAVVIAVAGFSQRWNYYYN
jgi:hypothetical protein